MSRSAIQAKIDEYASKLTQLQGPESKRVKKRCLQALGKLKKQLAALDGGGGGGAGHGATNGGDDDDDADGSDGDGDDGAAATGPAAGSAPTAQLSRKQLKSKTKLLNKELAEYAQKKQLKMAKKRFKWGVKKGMEPDKHTYANMINCHVRCGDMDGALALLQDMSRQTRATVRPNIVIYTTLLKGHCERGDLAAAKRLLFEELASHGLRPTVRTVNTFVRGCVKVGAVQSALRAYQQVKGLPGASSAAGRGHGQAASKKQKRADAVDEQGDDDDDDDEGNDEEDDGEAAGAAGATGAHEEGQASLYEHVVELLCQGLRIDDAAAVAADAVASSSSSDTSTDSASMYICLGKACALVGQWAEADKWLACATEALASSKTFFLRHSMQQKFQAAHDDPGARAGPGPGPGGEPAGAGKKGTKRARSVELFLRHRRAELENELECWQAHLSAVKLAAQRLARESTAAGQLALNGHGKGANASDPLNAVGAESAVRGLYAALSRVLVFGYDGRGDDDDDDEDSGGSSSSSSSSSTSSSSSSSSGGKKKRKSGGIDRGTLPVAGHLLFALRDKFGLDRVRNALPGSVASPGGAPGDGDGDGRKARDTALKHAKQEVARRVLLAVPEEPGYIDVDALFAATPGADGSTRAAGGAATTTTLPVKLEICSGSGDWVVAHAAADMHTGPGQPARARWLALELRCDRAHQTLCKSVAAHWEHCAQMPLPQLAGTGPSPFGGLPNLAILSGDATKVLPRRLAPASIAALYVNHPEPPERTSGEGESQGAHLLTQAFFGEMHRVLADDGTLTIVTDNLPYGESLLRAVAKTAHEVLTKRRRGGGDGAAFVSATLAEHATGARVLQEALTVSHDGVVGSGGKTKAAGGEGGTGAGKWAVKGNGKGKAGMKRKAAAAANAGIDSDDDDDDDDDGEDDDDAGASTAASASASPGSLRLELWRGDSEDGDTGAPASSSYFDRLWERGRKKRRWFMVLRKLP